MHLRSLESTQKARVALGCASSYSYAFFVLSKLSACIRGYTHAKREQILNVRAFACACIQNNINRTAVINIPNLALVFVLNLCL